MERTKAVYLKNGKNNKIGIVKVGVVAVTVAETGKAIYRDAENGTSRNTVETVVSIAGGWLGRVILNAILPGSGTFIGSIIGTIGGSKLTQAITEAISDDAMYDIEIKSCKHCKKRFKIYLYKGETYSGYCRECLPIFQ